MPGSDQVIIRSYRPEDLDWVVDRHFELYHTEHGFDETFRAYVAEPVGRFGRMADPGRENLWVAEAQGRRIGMIAIVRAGEKIAQLRWFLVEPEMRGLGIGGRLIAAAVGFCKETGFRHVFLWTVSTMAGARKLYRSFGFVMPEASERMLWGVVRTEERWDLDLGEKPE